MKGSTNQGNFSFKVFPVLTIVFLVLMNSCTKQESFKQSTIAESSATQIAYLAKIRNGLKDSLLAEDFFAINFNDLYKSRDARSKNYFNRLYFKTKSSDDFLLIKTDSSGTILQGKIAHVQRNNERKIDSTATIIVKSLNRKNVVYLVNADQHKHTEPSTNTNKSTSSDVSSLMEEEEPAGEQTLPEVIVTGYIYSDDDPYYWYSYDGIMGTSSGGGGTYTYGLSETSGGGGGNGETIHDDKTINITYENADQPPIDLSKYLNCFSLLSDAGATYKIVLCSDIPVNGDPSKLFDFSTGACGHTFLQLIKTNGSTYIQQNIGFYPESGWKSIEANSPVNSKLVDNAGHEYNASLSVTVDAAHFQTALNEVQYYGKSMYDIDNFNCTDFALNVFNAASPELLSIPQYHIPGGMYGELSNTPQGLYNELLSLTKSGGYAGGQITIPGVAGYTGSSHGPCN